MPYRRRNYRRRPYRRRYYNRRRRSPDYAGMARTAFRTAKYLASVVNVEMKFHDVEPAASGPDVNGFSWLINGVAQGDTTTDRDGNSIRMHDIDFKFTIEKDPAADFTYARFFIVIDKQTDSTTPSLSDIVDTNAIDSFRNITFGKRFHVYYDRTVTLNDQRPSFEFTRHLRTRAHVRYSGTTDGIESIATNPIWLFVYTNEATDVPNFQFKSRLRFVDN